MAQFPASLLQIPTASLSGEPAVLHAPGRVGRHPLRRKTDSRYVVDVEARERKPAASLQGFKVYRQVAQQVEANYRPGLVVDVRA